MSKKWGLLCGDFHSGHLVGLTPPEYQHKFVQNSTTKRNKWYKISEELWVEFDKILKTLPKLDFAVFNGDLIDGKGKRSGGTESITSDMEEQANMAAKVINRVSRCGHKDMKKIATYGTPYHTSTDGDEWENLIVQKAEIDKIGAHEWIEVNGLVIDAKHHIGSSTVPYGRHTAVAKEAIWNEMWALIDMQPRADVVIRSHVHYFQHCGTSNKLCMTLPALQGMGSKFGAKQCSGIVDWGVVLFEITDKNNYEWHPIIRRIKSQKTKAIKI